MDCQGAISTPILQESLEEFSSEISEGNELLPSPLAFQDKKEEFFPPATVLDENGLGQDNQIEAKRSRQVTDKFCRFVNGPNCPLHWRMDSHSDAECSAPSLKQTNKKQGWFAVGNGKNKRFKRDLEQVVKVVDL